MTPLSVFLFYNNISRKELAEFLNVTPSYISRICSNDLPLTDFIRETIINNDRGWDTRFLMKDYDLSAFPIDANTVKLNERLIALETENKLLKEQLEWFKSHFNK